MSKELEALNILRDNHIQFTKEKYGKLAKKVADNIINLRLARWDILEKAIKRNEPMKPLIKDMGFEHYDIYCPSCKEYIGYKNSVRLSLTLKYCPDCGQKLDLSDDKYE